MTPAKECDVPAKDAVFKRVRLTGSKRLVDCTEGLFHKPGRSFIARGNGKQFQHGPSIPARATCENRLGRCDPTRPSVTAQLSSVGITEARKRFSQIAVGVLGPTRATPLDGLGPNRRATRSTRDRERNVTLAEPRRQVMLQLLAQ